MKLHHNQSVMPDLIRHPDFSGSSFDFASFDSAAPPSTVLPSTRLCLAQDQQDKQGGESACSELAGSELAGSELVEPVEPVELRLEVYPALDAGLRSGRDDGLKSFTIDQTDRLRPKDSYKFLAGKS